MGGAVDDKQRLRRTFRRFSISRRRIRDDKGQLWADLDKDLVHHIRTVLRIGTGAKIILFDNTGKEYLAEITSSTPSHVQTRILEQSEPKTESGLEIVLAQALLKEQAFDHVLTAATELGVSKIIPITSNRVVAKIDAREADKKLFRWKKILEESASQSGRVKLPEISYPVGLDQLLKENFSGPKIILWEKARGGELAAPAITATVNAGAKMLLLIGPEGGFEDEEADRAIAAGFLPLGLGPRVLRAQTAPIAALAILQYLFGDLAK